MYIIRTNCIIQNSNHSLSCTYINYLHVKITEKTETKFFIVLDKNNCGIYI